MGEDVSDEKLLQSLLQANNEIDLMQSSKDDITEFINKKGEVAEGTELKEG